MSKELIERLRLMSADTYGNDAADALESPEADRDSWERQAGDRLDDVLRVAAERDALAAELKALREQSPAGKLHSDSIDGHVFIPTGGDWSCLGMSLYARPVPARELTDEEILNALDAKVETQFLTMPVTCKELWLTAGSVDVREFVRAIEAAMRGEDNV